MLRSQFILLAAFASASVVFAQPATTDTPYQVRYATKLDVADSVVNITNGGARGASLNSGTSAATTGAICANIFVFSPGEDMLSCCSCPVTPNGLVSLSAKLDLISTVNAPPTSIVIKLLATVPVAGTCSGSASTVTTATLAPGMIAWGTTIHVAQQIPGAPAAYGVTETAFTPATLSAGELNKLGNLCAGLVANSTAGSSICKACRIGGL